MFYTCSIADLYFREKNLTGNSVSESFYTLQSVVQQVLNVETLILSCSRQHKETLRRVPEQMSLLYGNIFFSLPICLSSSRGLEKEYKLVNKYCCHNHTGVSNAGV